MSDEWQKTLKSSLRGTFTIEFVEYWLESYAVQTPPPLIRLASETPSPKIREKAELVQTTKVGYLSLHIALTLFNPFNLL